MAFPYRRNTQSDNFWRRFDQAVETAVSLPVKTTQRSFVQRRPVISRRRALFKYTRDREEIAQKKLDEHRGVKYEISTHTGHPAASKLRAYTGGRGSWALRINTGFPG